MLTAPRQIEGTPKPTYAKGRRCNDCGAFLSQYNRYNRCWAHRPEGRELSPLTRKDQREQFLDVIRELMEEPS